VVVGAAAVKAAVVSARLEVGVEDLEAAVLLVVTVWPVMEVEAEMLLYSSNHGRH